MKELTGAELKDVQEQLTLLDVRTSDHYQHKHIPGAVNVPMGEAFASEVQTVLKDKDALVACYDKHEEESLAPSACAALEGAGYTNVICVRDGLMGWMEAGGMIESGQDS